MHLALPEQLKNIDLGLLQGNWTTILFMAFLVLTFLFLGRRTGKVAAMTLSVYVALAIINTADSFRAVAEPVTIQGFAIKLASFVLLICVMLILLSRSAILKIINHDYQAKLLHRALFAVASAGLLVTSIVSFLPTDMVATFSSEARGLFGTNLAITMWLIFPMAVLLLAKSKD